MTNQQRTQSLLARADKLGLRGADTAFNHLLGGISNIAEHSRRQISISELLDTVERAIRFAEPAFRSADFQSAVSQTSSLPTHPHAP